MIRKNYGDLLQGTYDFRHIRNDTFEQLMEELFELQRAMYEVSENAIINEYNNQLEILMQKFDVTLTKYYQALLLWEATSKAERAQLIKLLREMTFLLRNIVQLTP